MNGMTKIVKTISCFVAPAVIIFGVYLILHGHLTPGGGFAGGVIIAAGFILLTLALGKGMPLTILSKSLASILESSGALIFLCVALFGFTGGYFFLNVLPKGYPFTLLSGGTILISNIGIGLKVGTALFVVFIVLSMFRIRGKE